MMDFLAALERTRFSIWMRESTSVWGYPTVLFMHTVGMAMVAGLSATIALRILGVSPRTPIRPLERLYPFIWLGFAINAITGTMLVVQDATTKLANPDFYIKMVFVAAGVYLVSLIRRRIFRDPGLDKAPLPKNARGLAWTSLFCWSAAITAGRLLAYVGPAAGPRVGR